MSTLLKGARLLTNRDDCEVLLADVRIEGKRIKEIAPHLAPVAGEKVFDLRGKILAPGFVQTHVHLCQTLFRNYADDLSLLDWLSKKIWPMEGAHTEQSLRASAELGIIELLASGTTCILDMGTVRHTEQIFLAAQNLGIRAFIGKCLMDRDDNPKELRESTKAAIQETENLISKWHGQEEGRLNYAPAPRFVISCTEDLLCQVRDLAKDKGLHIHTHACENRDEIARVKQLTGKQNILYLHELGLSGPRLNLAHCVWLSAEEKQILKTTQTGVTHCPSSNLKLASGISPVTELLQQGINVSLGADGAPCNNHLDMFQEMRLASLLQKPSNGPTALPAREAYRMATWNGARALGLEKEIGSLQAGKIADLIAMDFGGFDTLLESETLNPQQLYSNIVYAGSPKNVTHTWVAGRLVYENGDFPGFDAEALKQRALKERRTLLDTLGQAR